MLRHCNSHSACQAQCLDHAGSGKIGKQIQPRGLTHMAQGLNKRSRACARVICMKTTKWQNLTTLQHLLSSSPLSHRTITACSFTSTPKLATNYECRANRSSTPNVAKGGCQREERQHGPTVMTERKIGVARTAVPKVRMFRRNLPFERTKPTITILPNIWVF